MMISHMKWNEAQHLMEENANCEIFSLDQAMGVLKLIDTFMVRMGT